MKKSSLIMNECSTALRTRSGLPIYKKKIHLPSVIVTDNDRALRAAISTIFNTFLNMLCFIYLQRNFEINLMQHVAESNKDKRDLIKLHIQAIFQDIALRADTKQSMEEAVSKMKEYFLKADVCKASKEKDKEDSTGITIKSIKNEVKIDVVKGLTNLTGYRPIQLV